ncbi:hypothetical protein XM53_10760 [Roseovarius atlanticus]|uniref:DUF2946 domain-containing protein n=1 Tax=Roseovarius atlanticus TaxID=1641875 RepID=A0A0T5NUI6_9RHOB|nr:hypothetical protein [Roseovarius atlanticus]KRS12564.1 hypothetical protein XM53_10760 [Roseovarius atlanticus]
MHMARDMTAICKAALTVLLALFIAIRVVAQPTILAAPEPGVMALCSGGQIVYVSMETGLPVKNDGETGLLADPCPFFGVTAFDLAVDQTRPTPLQLPGALALVQTHRSRPVPGAPVQNAARAPPLSA